MKVKNSYKIHIGTHTSLAVSEADYFEFTQARGEKNYAKICDKIVNKYCSNSVYKDYLRNIGKQVK